MRIYALALHWPGVVTAWLAHLNCPNLARIGKSTRDKPLQLSATFLFLEAGRAQASAVPLLLTLLYQLPLKTGSGIHRRSCCWYQKKRKPCLLEGDHEKKRKPQRGSAAFVSRSCGPVFSSEGIFVAAHRAAPDGNAVDSRTDWFSDQPLSMC